MANTYIINRLYLGTVTATVVGTPNIYLYGPSSNGSPGTRGLYICEARSGASGNQSITYRYHDDQQTTPGTAAPSVYTAHGV